MSTMRTPPAASAVSRGRSFEIAAYYFPRLAEAAAAILSNFLPASKLIKLLESAARKFKLDKKRFGNAEARI